MIINFKYAAVMASLILALVCGCGGETKAKTFKVTGKILAGGNPITGLPPGEKPMVKFEEKLSKAQSYAKVSEDGAFNAELPAGDYNVTGSAGFSADSQKKGPGFVTKDLKVESDVSGFDLDVGVSKKK
ncbi:MAG: hypothetical protein ACKO16_15320 [Gemmataceae bacterium]|jgi:hypothetical protein